jgi:hypothetical protein
MLYAVCTTSPHTAGKEVSAYGLIAAVMALYAGPAGSGEPVGDE